MRHQLRALNSYGAVHVSTGVVGASSVQLIQMLFDGLVDSLAAAKGHMTHGDIVRKSEQLRRAGRIVLGLQGSLDFARGGDLATNLNDLYGYVSRRLIQINASNDLAGLEEVTGLMRDIRDAWRSLPGLLEETAPARLAMAS